MARKNETFRHGYNMKNFSETIVKEIRPAAQGRSIVNKQFLTAKPDATEAERNATAFYNENFSVMPENADSDKISDTQVGKLKKAYNLVKDYEQLAKSKLSRELLPAYYCPFIDMTETKYPDFNNPNGDPMKVSSEEAEKMCNDICNKKRSCIAYNVMVTK